MRPKQGRHQEVYTQTDRPLVVIMSSLLVMALTPTDCFEGVVSTKEVTLLAVSAATMSVCSLFFSAREGRDEVLTRGWMPVIKFLSIAGWVCLGAASVLLLVAVIQQ